MCSGVGGHRSVWGTLISKPDGYGAGDGFVTAKQALTLLLVTVQAHCNVMNTD